ncbi:hypothetical protein COHA_004823 [Chlorella ohadii]|uniref:Cation/H+ exchanger transmembrane domain-containing protein n=1 Tax=Chlorella ohadii TaxID=2649997 RepID=A0AAD5H5A4_9CHLO|nr:hypothetical protein COHA_004823 [Chlorella ohadii]
MRTEWTSRSFNYCTVPQQGNDAFLFAGVALLAGACALGKLAMVWVLLAGGALGAASYWANLRELGNGVALWLGISPPDLFFYAFIPPLALDSALHLDMFLFRKTWPHMLLTAFVMVIISAFLLTPFILFVLGFQGRGFNWGHVALFSAMVASTDALSVTAILKKSGGPQRLVTLIEGESLLNDASAITLFEILEDNADPSQPFPSVWTSLPTILSDTARLAGVGAGVGLGMSMALGYLLRWLRWHGMQPNAESVAVLACGFLSFYVANSPAQGSGVIAVVVFGLYGNFTRRWGMLSASMESGAFDAFWDACALGANALVFFWSGAACVNFLIRSGGALAGSAWSWAAIPPIYLALVVLRTGGYAAFNVTAFAWLREKLSWAEVVFAGWAGLRGSVSLIMIADFLTHSSLQLTSSSSTESERVNAEITLWTAAFVLLTLVINAPTLAPLVRLLRLDGGRARAAARARAKRMLCRAVGTVIEDLRQHEGELLQGANWEAVHHYCDLSKALKSFDAPWSAAKAQHGGSGADSACSDGEPLDSEPGASGDANTSNQGSSDPPGLDADDVLQQVQRGLPFLQADQDGAAEPAEPAEPEQQAQHMPAQPPGASSTQGGADVELGLAAVWREQALKAAGSASRRAATAEDEGGSRHSEPAYYSTVPAGAGAALQRQLAEAQRAQQAAQRRAAARISQPATPAEPAEGDASRTLTATAGRQLQRQLASQLAALRQQQQWQQQQQQQQTGGQSSSASPASIAGGESAGAGASAGPGSGARPPMSPPHGYTLSGAAGAALVAELRRQQAAQAAASGSDSRLRPASAANSAVASPRAGQLQRDLLGRRLPHSASASPRWAPTAAALPPVAVRPQPAEPTTYPSMANSTAGSTGSLPPGFGLPLPAVAPAAAATPLAAQLELRRGLRMLEYCFAQAAEHADQPLHVWSQLLRKEVQGGAVIRLAARALLATARAYAALPPLAQRATSWPFRKLSGLLRRTLGRRMLASCEAALEYGLALSKGQEQLLAADAQQAEQLQMELVAEAAAVQHFVAEREVEAPDFFQAIQSYRAAMAVLRHLSAFTHELFQSGAVDEGERDAVLAVLDKRERRLEITELKRGDMFWQATAPHTKTGMAVGSGLWIVLSGVVRRRLRLPPGGQGGIKAAVDGLLGEGGAGGKPSAVRCRLELLRLAAGHVLECSEADMQAAVKAHIQQQRRGKAPANLQQGMVGAAAAGDASSGPDGTETPLPHSPDVASKAAVHALAAQEHQWRAGSKGALLLVWLTAAGEEPPGWAEAQQAAAAAAAAAVREGCGTAEQQPSGSSGAPARRLMPWQHPFVRRLKPGA